MICTCGSTLAVVHFGFYKQYYNSKIKIAAAHIFRCGSLSIAKGDSVSGFAAVVNYH